jgi:hypothetical protein
MPRPALEVAGIFRQHGAQYRNAHRLSYEQLRVMRAIEVCWPLAQSNSDLILDKVTYAASLVVRRLSVAMSKNATAAILRATLITPAVTATVDQRRRPP